MLLGSLLLATLVGPVSPAPAPAAPTEVLAPEYREELDVLPEAERDIEEAKRLFDAGKQAASGSRWDEAIRYFALAYRYSASPGQLYSLGRGHRELYFNRGRDPVQLRLALLRFEQYLQRSPQGRNRDNATRYVAELAPYAQVLEGFDDEVPITRLMVHSPIPEATVAIDGGPAGPAPVTLDVPPGDHHVRVTAPGYFVVTRDIEVPEGATVPLEISLAARPAALTITGPRGAEVFVDGATAAQLPMRAPIDLPAGVHQIAIAQRGRTPLVRELQLDRGGQRSLDVELAVTLQRKLAYAALAVGSVGLVATPVVAGLAGRAQNQAQQAADERTSQGVSAERFAQEQQAWAQRDALRAAAIASGVVGVSVLGGGVILWLTDRPHLEGRLYRPERRVSAAGAFDGRRAIATLRGRF